MKKTEWPLTAITYVPKHMATITPVPDSPGPPLLPLSPEKLNRKPQTPTLRSDPVTEPNDGTPTPTAGMRSSDVHAKVAQFNTLSGSLSKEVAQRRLDLDAARKRAEMAREQAENEKRALRIQLDESKVRCSTLNQRLESALVRPTPTRRPCGAKC